VIYQSSSVPVKGVKPAQLDLISSLVIHIGMAALDEQYGQLVQLLKVIRRVRDLQHETMFRQRLPGICFLQPKQ